MIINFIGNIFVAVITKILFHLGGKTVGFTFKEKNKLRYCRY